MDAKELSKRNEQQQRLIKKYEEKLKNIIAAYRSLLAENEALQASVAALKDTSHTDAETCGHETYPGELPSTRVVASEVKDTVDALLNVVCQSESESQGFSHDVTHESIACLRRSLQILVKEKRRQEEAFMIDRKNLLAQITRMSTAKKHGEMKGNRYADLTNPETDSQQERLLHDIMLQYDQKLRETEELRLKLSGMKHLKRHVQHLENEMRESEERHHKNLKIEADRVKDVQAHYEEKIASLEAKIVDLTDALSECECGKETYAQMVDALKKSGSNDESVVPTSSKEAATREEASRREEATEERQPRSSASVSNTTATENAEVPEFDALHSAVPVATDANAEYSSRYFRLLEEFENFKVRMASSRDTNAPFQAEEVKRLKEAIAELQSKLVKTQEEMRRAETRCATMVDDFQCKLNDLKACHSETIKKKEEECLRKVFDLENELRKQRERTLDLVLEKDKELEVMQAILRARSDSTSLRSSFSEGVAEDSSSALALNATSQLLSSTLSQDGHHQPSLIGQYTAAVSNVEMTRLRAEVRELKDQLCDLKRTSLFTTSEQAEKIELQKQEIMNLRIRLMRSQHDTNLEYLKNVLLQYMTSDRSADRRYMVKALATLLNLSPSELQRLQRCSSRPK